MSARRLIAAVACGVAVGLSTAPAQGASIQGAAKADTTPDKTAAEGVLFVGRQDQAVAQIPTSPAGAGRRWRCRFYQLVGGSPGNVAYVPGMPMVAFGQVTPEAGQQYVLLCTDESGARVVDRLTRFTPGDPAGMLAEGPVVDWGAVRVGIAAVRPRVQTSPSREGRQVVNVETWFWVENFDEIDASLRGAGGVSGFGLTISAADVRLEIDPGDGSGRVFSCTREQMVVWSPGGPKDTGCGYRYFRRSSDQPGGVWRATATLVYENLAWSATGPDGAPFAGAQLDPIRSEPEAVPLVVHDYQAVIR